MSKHREERNPRGLIVLWHAAFMTLYVDFDPLERAIGRDGTDEAAKVSDRVKAWAGLSEAKHCVLYSLLVLKNLEMLLMGLEPAIHVPKSLFYSAVVTYCYIICSPSLHALSTPIERRRLLLNCKC
ncbi:hypothetical protein DER44DRAFT_376374 [Fusarium oxysporum]|nr:hypothetical protein DER44DRAFT_376374 [Fusarium oxysporum]